MDLRCLYWGGQEGNGPAVPMKTGREEGVDLYG